MEYDRLMRLIEKMECKLATSAELDELDLFYQSFELADGITQKFAEEKFYKANLLAKIKLGIAAELAIKQSDVRKFWYVIAAVASIAVIVFGTGLLYSGAYPKRTEMQQTVLFTKDISAGRNGATLTLSSGKTIYISDASTGKLADASGVTISKSADGEIVYNVASGKPGAVEYNSLQTSNGEQTTIILPDKSKVFLNAGSSIRYPSTFSNVNERIVELLGEAYFEVAKDEHHPFIVKTTEQEVQVLGTHFNISSYRNESIVKTTLLEGSVKINGNKVLRPGEMAINNKSEIQVVAADIQLETAWRHNDFYFKEEPMGSVMRKIARWYNVTVDYTDERLRNVPISGFISRTKPISIILDRLGAAGHMRFTIVDKKITVLQENK